jgi:hypothetical protein
MDRRIRFLSKRLESAEVVDSNLQKKRDQVFFGATVTYANWHGTEMTITIVGIDEADLDRGEVSWLSPVARALMKARQGASWNFARRRGSSRSRCSASVTTASIARLAEYPRGPSPRGAALLAEKKGWMSIRMISRGAILLGDRKFESLFPHRRTSAFRELMVIGVKILVEHTFIS